MQREWAAEQALAKLVPAERVFTGEYRGTVTVPYAVIVREGAPLIDYRTSDGQGQRAYLRVSLYVTDAELVTGRRAMRQLRRRLDRGPQTMADPDITLQVAQVAAGVSEELAADGVWKLTQLWEVRTHEPEEI